MLARRRAAIALGVACAQILAGGCANSRPPQEPAISPSSAANATPSPYTIAIELPTHPKQLTNTPIGITLTSKPAGSAVDHASVVVTLTMPTMVMPSLTTTCTEIRPGYYRGETTFTMPGDWQIDGDARIAGKLIASKKERVRVQ